MGIEIREKPANFCGQYGTISIAFEVRERFVVEPASGGLGGARLTRRVAVTPYTKDYDALPEQRPEGWSGRWDLGLWRLYAAFSGDGEHIGGAAVIFETAQVYGEKCDPAEAVLWDIRVRRDQRNRGVGKQLLAFAEERAGLAGKRRISVETQNNNVPACRLYASAGYSLRSFDRFAYATLPDEGQLIWSKSLSSQQSAG